MTTRWVAFSVVAIGITILVVVLARASQDVLVQQAEADTHDTDEGISTGFLFANVVASQGLLALVLVGTIWLANVPLGSLGLDRTVPVREIVLIGVGVGIACYFVAEVGAAVTDRLGFDRDESLRTWLAPSTEIGWIALLVIVLPIIAIFEELLFRAVLIGALAAGFGLPVWALVLLSSLLFAIGHGAQGTAGILVTGVIGILLAVVFVWSGSLLVVIVAHYVVNTLEFLIHEGLGFEWPL